jgi:hypothetical protein
VRAPSSDWTRLALQYLLDLKCREQAVEIVKLQRQVSRPKKRGGQAVGGLTVREAPSSSSQVSMASEGAEHPTRDKMVPPSGIIGGSSSVAEAAPERTDTGGGDKEGGLGAQAKRRKQLGCATSRQATSPSPKQVSGALPISGLLVLDGLTSASALHCRVGAVCIDAIRQVVVLTSDGDMCDAQGTCAIAASTGGKGALSTQPPLPPLARRASTQVCVLCLLMVKGVGVIVPQIAIAAACRRSPTWSGPSSRTIPCPNECMLGGGRQLNAALLRSMQARRAQNTKEG